MLVPLLIGFGAGAATMTIIQRRRLRRARIADDDSPGFRQGVLNAPQLLAWIDAATQGWLILSPDLSIAYINARAERLLHISRNLLVRGMPMDAVLSIPKLCLLYTSDAADE